MLCDGCEEGESAEGKGEGERASTKEMLPPHTHTTLPAHLGSHPGTGMGCAQLIPLATMQPEPCFVVPTLPSLDPGLSRPHPPPVSIPDSETRTVQQDSRAIKTTRHQWLQNLLGIARQVLQSDAPHLLGIARPVLVRPPRRAGGPKLAAETRGQPPPGAVLLSRHHGEMGTP